MNKLSPTPNSIKPLLVLAHYGEAESLIHLGAFVKRKEQNLEYFENEHYRLFLTGEGKYSVLTSLSHFLATFAKLTSKLINLGLAAALEEKFALDKSFFIRSCYQSAENPNEFEFKSFSSDFYEKPYVDCLSLNSRLLKVENRNLYLPIASIFDREAWAIGFVCKYFSLPFVVRKTISDHPHLKETECKKIIKQKDFWSELIAQDFFQHVAPILNGDQYQVELPTHPIFFDKDFYFTFAMKNLWNLKSKFFTKLDECILEAKEQNLKPKDRSIWLFAKLSSSNPEQTAQNELLACFAELSKHIKIRENEDRAEYELFFPFKDPNELDDLKRMVSSIEKERYRLLIEGRIDVF